MNGRVDFSLEIFKRVSLIPSLEKFFLELDVYSYSETDTYDSMIDSEELLF